MLSKSIILKFIYRLNLTAIKFPYAFVCLKHDKLIQNLCYCSVTQSCATLCSPMDCNTSGLPVHHQLLQFSQTHVHWVNDAIQPSYPLSSPSLLALNLSQHHSLIKWVSSSHQMAKILSFSFNISPSKEHPGLIPLGWTGWIFLQSKGLKSLLQHYSSKA